MNGRDFDIRQRGRLGEGYVCDYLKNKGYIIVETNYKSRFGEIDVIAKNDKIIAFVEVKTSTARSLTGGFERITKSKITKLTKTIGCYIAENRIDLQPRIDCAEVIVNKSDNSLVDVKYIENAVESTAEYSPF